MAVQNQQRLAIAISVKISLLNSVIVKADNKKKRWMDGGKFEEFGSDQLDNTGMTGESFSSRPRLHRIVAPMNK